MKKQPPTNSLLNWLDRYLLTFLAGFLLVFIPLMPKLPLADVLPGYIVRVRIEDFAILLTTLVWFVQIIRRRVSLPPLATKLVGAYLIVGLLSTLSAIFITRTVPWSEIHIFKLYFHYFRRLEYFSLFFILYSSLKTVFQAKVMILIQILVVIAVTIYGFGQKYLYWPVYSTMNREFSKGWRLYLTEHARVPSTFGGHYDAAAFTMMITLIALAVYFFSSRKIVKAISAFASLASLWLLILTASRTSFIGYLAGVTVLFILIGIHRSIKYALPRWFGVILFSLFIMLSFGDLSERYAQVFKLDQLKSKYQSLLFEPKVQNPVGKDIALKPEDLVSVKSDQPPVTEKPNAGLPGDVYEAIPDKQVYFDDAGEVVVVEVERTYSDNAYKYGLSAAIRLDALWPRAVQGFLSNPILGSGYSTLTKESVGQFTEAESTDNDYLRNLGETGVLGFITFFGFIGYLVVTTFRSIARVKEPLFQAYLIGFIAATFALLLNAVYIDVFEASKVAETYWAMAGIALALPLLKTRGKAISTHENG